MRPLPNSGFPPGTIALAAGNTPRFYEFTQSMERLIVPDGTEYIIRRSCDVAMNFNRCVAEMTGEWVWFLGDDHSFVPDTLMRLLKKNVDVVVPISPCKVFPFAPCVIHRPSNGEFWSENMELYTWEELSGDGLLCLPQGDFIGQAGMLVKKRVLEAIGPPWFKTGMINQGRLQEDIWFCHEIQKHGFEVWVDQTIIFDHWFFQGITARKHEGNWVPALVSGAMTVVLPDAKPVRELKLGQGVQKVA